jgi:hypothetical protein
MTKKYLVCGCYIEELPVFGKSLNCICDLHKFNKDARDYLREMLVE